MVIVTAMLCLIFGMIYSFTKSGMETESISMMQAVAARPMQPGSPERPSDEVRLPYFVLHVGRDGKPVAAGGGYYDLSDEQFLKSLADAAFAQKKQTGVIEEYNLRFCKVAAPMGQSLVFADMSSELATLSSLRTRWKSRCERIATTACCRCPTRASRWTRKRPVTCSSASIGRTRRATAASPSSSSCPPPSDRHKDPAGATVSELLTIWIDFNRALD